MHFYTKDWHSKKDEYKKFKGYDFSKLFDFYRSLYGGDKLQNHALNSRVNGEFANKFNLLGKELIIINEGRYALHIDMLYVGEEDISKVVKTVIEKYIDLLKEKDSSLVAKLKLLLEEKDAKVKKDKINELLEEKAEARIFEIISYAILKNYYKTKFVYFGYELEDVKKEFLELYKTGRTNANDGGIDFVMRPVGRLFQVTEVESYDKYLLDMDKVVHFPITFVIKTEKLKVELSKEISDYIEQKSGGMAILKDKYNKCIEEIITINELRDYLNLLDTDAVNQVLIDIDIYPNKP